MVGGGGGCLLPLCCDLWCFGGRFGVRLRGGEDGGMGGETNRIGC